MGVDTSNLLIANSGNDLPVSSGSVIVFYCILNECLLLIE